MLKKGRQNGLGVTEWRNSPLRPGRARTAPLPACPTWLKDCV